jgi:hypothetical protein
MVSYDIGDASRVGKRLFKFCIRGVNDTFLLLKPRFGIGSFALIFCKENSGIFRKFKLWHKNVQNRPVLESLVVLKPRLS